MVDAAPNPSLPPHVPVVAVTVWSLPLRGFSCAGCRGLGFQLKHLGGGKAPGTLQAECVTAAGRSGSTSGSPGDAASGRDVPVSRQNILVVAGGTLEVSSPGTLSEQRRLLGTVLPPPGMR